VVVVAFELFFSFCFPPAANAEKALPDLAQELRLRHNATRMQQEVPQQCELGVRQGDPPAAS